MVKTREYVRNFHVNPKKLIIDSVDPLSVKDAEPSDLCKLADPEICLEFSTLNGKNSPLIGGFSFS